MADMHDIVKLAVDAYRGNVEKYSVKQSMDTLHAALVEANNGKTHLDYKDIRDGKCSGLFSLIEEILSVTVVEGLQGDEFFMALVDFRNLAEGDENIFEVEDRDLFVVAEVADGTQGIRRQRLGGVSQTSIPTTLKMVRIYEEMNRVLAGRVDFNQFIQKVADSFKQKLLNDIYALWAGASAEDLGGTCYYPAAGSFDEDVLLGIIAHVEAAANGQPATIVGTKAALRKISESIVSDGAKEEIHGLGYLGKFYGTPVVCIPQRHKIGSTEFVMDDNCLSIIAGSDKPIKVVYEGNPIVLMGDTMSNADFTNEYLYAEKYGMGIVLAGGNSGIGRYELA